MGPRFITMFYLHETASSKPGRNIFHWDINITWLSDHKIQPFCTVYTATGSHSQLALVLDTLTSLMSICVVTNPRLRRDY